MEHVAVGKLLPNLKVTVGNDGPCIDNSEERSFDKSESHSDNSGGEQDVKIVRSWMNSLQNPKVYKNKGGAFTTGLDLLSECNTEKLDKRAERFGIEREDSSAVESISSLYESMGVDIENKNSVKMKNIRLDALHVRGVNELNTNDIFQYFQDYGPASVEWINDFSCNVVWMDEATCARALLGISRPLKVAKGVIMTEEMEFPQSETSEQSKPSNPDDDIEAPVDTSKQKEMSMEMDDASDTKSCSSGEIPESLDIPVPPGSWRLGIPHLKGKSILLRFATKDDRKLRGAEKRSVFYQKYGNPNYGGLRGLISGSRKRKMQAATNKRAVEIGSSKSEMLLEDSSDAGIFSHVETVHNVDAPVSKPRPPRMRMYADDEELKAKSSRFKNIESEKPSVHSRLGVKYTKDDLCHLGSYNREREERNRPFFSDREREERDRPFFSDQEWEDRGRPFFSDKKERDRPRQREERNRPYLDDDNYRTKGHASTSSWDRKRNFSHDQEDLRTKIKKLKAEGNDISKHRSPLCVD